jgi:hypothetical protein
MGIIEKEKFHKFISKIEEEADKKLFSKMDGSIFYFPIYVKYLIASCFDETLKKMMKCFLIY